MWHYPSKGTRFRNGNPDEKRICRELLQTNMEKKKIRTTVGASIDFPLPYEIFTTFIPGEVERIRFWVDTFKESWKENVITTMCDDWTNNDNKIMVNFLLYKNRAQFIISSTTLLNSTTMESIFVV